MRFADLKNDFVFRRVFGEHPEILQGLLGDLLDRQGERAIETVVRLPPENAPHVAGAKLPIVDVQCVDRSGASFVVQVQLIHVQGFLDRVVYDVCNACITQLAQGERYTKLANVVAVSICDFSLWPDKDQDAQRLPRVPMVSRWNLTEPVAGTQGLQDVEYVFLELGKAPAGLPETRQQAWAWLFTAARGQTDIPRAIPEGAYRQALRWADEDAFSAEEMNAYRKAAEEIDRARLLARDVEAWGKAKAKAEAKAEAIVAMLQARGIAIGQDDRDRIAGCGDLATLDAWIRRAAVATSAEELMGTGT
jgi:predicted transposase/invertase (TIGR01784 family)